MFVIFSPMSIALMSPVDYKKRPCCPAEFKGQRVKGDTLVAEKSHQKGHHRGALDLGGGRIVRAQSISKCILL